MTFKLIPISEQSRIIADVAPVMVWMSGTDKNRFYFNKRWLDYTGHSLEEEFNEAWIKDLHPEDVDRYLQEYSAAFDKRQEFKAEYRLRNNQGEYRWFMDHGVPYFSDENVFLGYVGSCNEIQSIKEVDQRKDEFINAASHELKTPVTTMKVYTQMLMDLMTSIGHDQGKVYTLKIEQQTNKLLKLISNLLDLTKIQANRFELEKEDFNFRELMDELIENHEATITTHTIELIGDCDFVLRADRDRIGQVLYNLIDNAKKYSPHADKITIKVTRTDQELKIEITDYGIGISPEDQARIFERFYRAGFEHKTSFPGLGIGLFLSMQIIREHHGHLNVKSSPGQGSTFALSLPLNQ